MTTPDDADPFPPAGDTFATHDVRAPTLGIETRQQKAELETALFGQSSAPVEIAHYTVIGTLGTGGMGVVYVAHDRQLDRRVALKLLRQPGAGGTAQARLLREAQAMARLSHPNVVTVHEVGTHEGQVFVAMEFVGGSNLRSWLQNQRRSWEQIRAIFIQAGEGLAAAHEAGLIHRDFKPDNVLVGDDGRVRVADFGLAHGLAAANAGREREPSTHASVSGSALDLVSLDAPLTETGTLLGTPAYMAPEQHTGARVDERSDQFAFCVALWEALYGARPFPGSTLADLIEALLAGRIAAPKNERGIPPWLHEILRRGLQREPGERWASMRELLTALGRDPERIRRRRLRAAGLLGVSLAIMAVLGNRAASERRHNLRQRYWNTLTESLLELERERGLAQATDDARRARNATRMAGYRRYRPKAGAVEREDPTVAAALLREFEGDERRSEAWISAANDVLGQPLSHAVLSGHSNVIVDVVFGPSSAATYTASSDGEVWRWSTNTGAGAPIIRHAREVVGLAISPDGRWVASASKDGRTRLWSGAGASEVITAHDGELTALAFAPTGRLLASAAADGNIYLAELASARTRELDAHDGPIHALSFDASGEHLLTAGADHRARVWRIDDGTRVAEFTGHADAIYHARFVDERQVVTGSDDGTVRLWTLDGPQTGELLTTHAGEITALEVHADRVASAGADERVHIVELDARSDQVTLTPPAQVWSMRFVAEGERLITGSWDGSAQLWSSHGGAALRTFFGHREPILRVEVDPSGRWLATASYDLDVRLWDLERELLWTSLRGHRKQISALALTDDETILATGARDRTVRLWTTGEARALARLDAGGTISALGFGPNDAYLAAGTGSGIIELWRVDDRRQRTLEGHKQEVWQVAFDGSGSRLASASLDGTIRVWDVAKGQLLLTLRDPAHLVTAVAFEPGDRRIVSASGDGSLRIWDLSAGTLTTELRGHTGKIWSIARSPDGEVLASASDDGTARLWPDEDPAHAIVLAGHRQPVWSIAFDTSGERVITTSFDHDARIWRVSDGALLRTLSGHSETVWSALFTPDGGAVTASDDNTVRVWPADADDPTLVLSGHTDAVTKLALNTSGTLLVSGSSDANVKLWRLDHLTTNVEELDARLHAATTWCLDADMRVRELGEDPIAAARAEAACEARYGRARRD